MHVVVRFLCTVSVGLCVGSVSAQSKFDKLLEVLADRDNCIAAVERDISEIEMSETLDTKRLFVSLLAGLPTQAREALKRAAVSSEAELPNFSDGQIGGIAYDGLLERVRSELGDSAYPSIENCGALAVELIPKLIYRWHVLPSPSRLAWFLGLGLEDSRDVEQLVLAILALEAGGNAWEAQLSEGLNYGASSPRG